jgi:hypothetical protein
VTVTVTPEPSIAEDQNMTMRESISFNESPTPGPTIMPSMSPTSTQSPGFDAPLVLACLAGMALLLARRKFR